MESIESKSNILEHGEKRREKFIKRFFNRHLAFVVLSALLSTVPQQELRAQKNEQVSIKKDSVEAERKSLFQKLRSLVEKEGIVDKISRLKESFGPAIDGFLDIHRINQDLNSLVTLDKRKTEDDIFVNKSGPQFMTMGSIVASAYKDRWEHRKSPNRPISFKNINEIPGFSSKDLQDFLNKTYPKNYVSNSTSEIEFVGQSYIKEKENTEILGQAESFGIGTLMKSQSGDLRTPLKINLPTTGIDKEIFIDILEHEIGHPNDWNNSPVLTSAERVLMLHEVSLRSKSANRFVSSYVEGITLDQIGIYFKGKIDDEKTKEQYLGYIKTSEYWAEIAKAYFKDKNKFKKEHPDDYVVVKKWVDVMSK